MRNYLRGSSCRLHQLQSDVTENQRVQESRIQMIKDNKTKAERLERDAKNYEEKQRVEKKIELLEKKRKWSLLEEAKVDCQVRKRKSYLRSSSSEGLFSECEDKGCDGG